VNSKLFVAGSIVALALCGAGAAVADSGHKGAVHKPKLSVKAHVVKVAQDSRVGPGAVFDAAVGYLQIDKQTLFEDLRNGQSLAQIAVAQGKTSDGLIDVVVAAARAQLDVAVAAGKLDAAKEQTLLAKMRTALGTLVTKSVGGGTARTDKPQRPWPVPVFLQPLPGKPVLDITTILNALKSGQTAAQITATIKTNLDAAVAAGRLTAAQESLILSKLSTATHLAVGGNS
jgi:hypothetical protein